MSQTLAITVHGKVQGVFFRASVNQLANQLNLVGFVQNLPDGSVFIQATGDSDSLNKLVSWCHEGPDHAQVNQVDSKSINTPSKLPPGFHITSSPKPD